MWNRVGKVESRGEGIEGGMPNGPAAACAFTRDVPVVVTASRHRRVFRRVRSLIGNCE
jgi:hypothetical protein